MLIKVCPKSGERQSKNDFLLIFFYIQSKGAAQSSILMILRHPHSLYSFGPVNLYFPFPYPLTASISPAFFSLVIRLPAAVTESFVIAAISERPKIPSIPIFSKTTIAFLIVFWLAFNFQSQSQSQHFCHQSQLFQGQLTSFNRDIIIQIIKCDEK